MEAVRCMHAAPLSRANRKFPRGLCSLDSSLAQVCLGPMEIRARSICTRFQMFQA